jgi:hypothetical protein
MFCAAWCCWLRAILDVLMLKMSDLFADLFENLCLDMFRQPNRIDSESIEYMLVEDEAWGELCSRNWTEIRTDDMRFFCNDIVVMPFSCFSYFLPKIMIEIIKDANQASLLSPSLIFKINDEINSLEKDESLCFAMLLFCNIAEMLYIENKNRHIHLGQFLEIKKRLAIRRQQ